MNRSRILVVDDELSMLRTMERVLGTDYRVAAASTPDEAMAAMRELDPHLAVIDIRMPDLDGFRLTSKLRQVNPELDVIFMTGAVHELDAQLIRAIREKAFYFIQKPFDRDVLLTLVDRCLEQRRLAEENRRYVATLEAELAAARAFQQSLLPAETACIGAVNIAGMYQPCDSLGGDLFDYVDVGDGRVTLLVADVSGHGVSAAMITGVVKSAFHEARVENWEPCAVVTHVAAALRPFEADRFVTLFCARLDPEGGRLEYVNAGHPAPYLWGPGTTRKQLTPTGPLISPAFPDIGWELGTTDLRADDQLFVYTDGLTEARDDGGFFGERRIEELLDGTSSTGMKLLMEVSDAVERFTHGRPADDDRTMAAVSSCRE